MHLKKKKRVIARLDLIVSVVFFFFAKWAALQSFASHRAPSVHLTKSKRCCLLSRFFFSESRSEDAPKRFQRPSHINVVCSAP